jgi:NAD(P)-dependent dehydrogenase (short-subunit alcohol dehydrogenase family)
MKFANKHVAITCGAGEIGLSIARKFAGAGARVTLLDEVLPDAVGSAIRDIGAEFRPLDVTDPQAVASMIRLFPANKVTKDRTKARFALSDNGK